MQSPGLFGVGFPSPGPRVWTFTSFQSAMPGAPGIGAVQEYGFSSAPSPRLVSAKTTALLALATWGFQVGLGARESLGNRLCSGSLAFGLRWSGNRFGWGSLAFGLRRWDPLSWRH